MVSQFVSLQKFRSLALTYLQNKKIGEIVFSGPTYQVEILEKDQKLWPFLQFDEKGNLKDAFCSCESHEGSCIHLAAALLKIYNGHSTPLHVRYANSFWNKLCQLFADHCGYGVSCLTHVGKTYSYTNELTFSITPTAFNGEERLRKILEKRERETPENSLKFSNLSQEEVTHWKEGRPNKALRYELSFWSDLAKYFMLMQEEDLDYQIHFTEKEKCLPTHFVINFPHLHIEAKVTVENLEALIPTLEAVQSNLKIRKTPLQNIEKITYDPLARVLLIHHKENQHALNIDYGTTIGQWLYIPHVGFHLEAYKSILDQTLVTEDLIDQALSTYSSSIKKHLKGLLLEEDKKHLSYEIYFDELWNLHFEGYLFEKNDLSGPFSFLFREWVYVHQKGFFRIEEPLFPNLKAKLLPEQISSFINQHRIWLNAQEGFQTHLAGIEGHLNYSVSKNGTLKFGSKPKEESHEMKDFGDWIYVKNEGFFSKKLNRLGEAVRPGVEVSSYEVGSFIRKYKEELEILPHFFYPICPLSSIGLKLTHKNETALSVTPFFIPLPAYSDTHIRLFDDYVYLQGKGFYELPLPWRLPSGYNKEITIGQEKLTSFFNEEFPKLEPHILNLPSSFKKPHLLDLEVHELSRKPQGGLIAQIYYRTEYGLISLYEISSAIQKKRSFLFSPGGRIDLKDPLFTWIKDLENSSFIGDDKLHLSTMEFLRLEAFQGLLGPKKEAPQYESTHSLLHELRDFVITQKPKPKGLKSVLRLYQQTGLSWLWFLYCNQLSGLLCDEMGLGKTHQAMALMASILHKLRRKKVLFLVVCPTSVIYHWQEKLQTFLPDLEVFMYHGIKRSLKEMPKGGVFLTTYGILRLDSEKLSLIDFELAIFDEIQTAKNSQSQIHKALTLVKATMRLGLTGTPIENNLRELKALFDIVLPGFLPTDAKYKELFANPIEKEKNNEKRLLLNRLIHPFALRRRKKEVLQELPEKTEDKVYCDLSADQEKLYIDTLEKARKQVLSDLQQDALPIPYVHIFSILTTLKQICDHPALLLKDPTHYKETSSSKWDIFKELIEEALESEQKVVVFTQYLHMLDIMSLYFKEREWDYAEIRGSTQDRKEQLIKFQEDPNCKIFIGSLNAAGVGIDLTAANVVILYDRWWNAARENQAIDRVHRIGQKWGVQVFKLITKKTIEEKIDGIISQKGELMEEVMFTDDQSTIKKFTRDELIQLLSY